jgi:hypothetical protein
MRRVDLSRLQDDFVRIVQRYIDKHGMERQKLAKKIRLHPVEISNLMMVNSETGAYRRKLTANYLMPFIQGGVIRVADIDDGNPKNKSEVEMWSMARIFERTMELKNLGANPEAIMELAISAIKHGCDYIPLPFKDQKIGLPLLGRCETATMDRG